MGSSSQNFHVIFQFLTFHIKNYRNQENFFLPFFNIFLSQKFLFTFLAERKESLRITLNRPQNI